MAMTSPSQVIISSLLFFLLLHLAECQNRSLQPRRSQSRASVLNRSQSRAFMSERAPSRALLSARGRSKIAVLDKTSNSAKEDRARFSPGIKRKILTRSSVGKEPSASTRQGSEGFAYEVSHPVLDEYGNAQTATQYHGQDGQGRYRYSFRHPGSRREEYVDENGNVQGSFSYKTDDEDKISMAYYADDSGFHVKRAVLPPLAARAPRDEPLVAAIKLAHNQLWREMWLRAAVLSLGQPLPADTPELMMPQLPEVLPPADVAELVVSPPEAPVPSLESDVISFDDDSDEDQPPPPAADEPVVPIFPGAPDAPPRPVASAPPVLPPNAEFSSPDQQTVVVEAGDTSATFNQLRAGVIGGSTEARSGPTTISAEGRRREALAHLQRVMTHHRGVMAQLRVSDEAARLGGVPVAARHDRAQVRPNEVAKDRPIPVLDDPLLYFYTDLLYETSEAAKTPELVVV